MTLSDPARISYIRSVISKHASGVGSERSRIPPSAFMYQYLACVGSPVITANVRTHITDGRDSFAIVTFVPGHTTKLSSGETASAELDKTHMLKAITPAKFFMFPAQISTRTSRLRVLPQQLSKLVIYPRGHGATPNVLCNLAVVPSNRRTQVGLGLPGNRFVTAANDPGCAKTIF